MKDVSMNSPYYLLAEQLVYTREALEYANQELNNLGMFGVEPDKYGNFEEDVDIHLEVVKILKQFRIIKKVLLITGDDYAALQFEQRFSGIHVWRIIEDMQTYLDSFLEAHPEYVDSFRMEVADLDINEKSLNYIKESIGDYDALKTTNIYLETQTL